jgi:hypothetical protein
METKEGGYPACLKEAVERIQWRLQGAKYGGHELRLFYFDMVRIVVCR